MIELPSGWASTRLGDLVEVVRGISFPSEVKGIDSEGRVACLRTKNVQQTVEWEDLLFVPAKYVKKPSQYVRAGDILISTANSLEHVGKVAYVDRVFRQATIGAFISILRTGPGLDPRFMFFHLSSPLARAAVRATASTTTNISNISLLRCLALECRIPPLSEQRRIVAEIEKQFTRLDEILSQLTAAQRRCEKLSTAIVRKAFARNLPTRPLRELASIKGGLTMHADRLDLAHCSAVPYLRVANVQRGSLNLAVVKEIMATPEEIDELLLQAGDVLFTEGGDRDKLGRGWVWQGEIKTCIHQNHIFRARMHGLVLSKWVSYYANEPGRDYFQREGKQTTNLASINLTKLGALPVPIAPLDEQEKVVQQIEAQLSGCQHMALELANSQLRAARLRQAILTKAFSGQLVPQDPKDEPASVLLNLIRSERLGALTRNASSP